MEKGEVPMASRAASKPRTLVRNGSLIVIAASVGAMLIGVNTVATTCIVVGVIMTAFGYLTEGAQE